ncbi:MAG: cytochrome c oxidase subunit 3 [Armatimonadetes bacterium]|nr:cytochrome c oxidase subunit 3 [Armatimonadota bacterium]
MTDTLQATLNPAEARIEEGQHHFDYGASKMGMWLFLFTEFLLFGGLFISYAVYRFLSPGDFHNAAQNLNLSLGVVNTVVLLTSSLTIAMAVTALQKGSVRLSVGLICATIALAIVFLVIKYFEWSAKFQHGLYPGGAELGALTKGQQQYFNLYFVMTGLHGLHLVFGTVLLAIVGFIVARRSPAAASGPEKSNSTVASQGAPEESGLVVPPSNAAGEPVMRPQDYVVLENAALYWHLVDVVWFFIFPLLYLIT